MVLGFTQPMSPRGAVLWVCIHQLPGFSIAPYSFIPCLLGSARPFGAGDFDRSAPVDPATAAFDMSIPAQAVRSQHVF